MSWYQTGINTLFSGQANFIQGTNIYVMLLDKSYTPDYVNHQYVSDVSSSEISATNYTRTSISGGTISIGFPSIPQYLFLTCNNVIWTNTTFSATYVVFYVNTGNDSTSPLLLVSTNSAYTQVSSSGGSWNLILSKQQSVLIPPTDITQNLFSFIGEGQGYNCVYQAAFTSLVTGGFSFISPGTGVLKIMLLTSAYSPSTANDAYVSDIISHETSGTGYSRLTLSPTLTKYTTDAIFYFAESPTQWTGSSFSARYAVLFQDNGFGDNSNPLLLYYDFGSTKTCTSTFTITWHAAPIGLFYIE